jgi:hypothetical protein
MGVFSLCYFRRRAKAKLSAMSMREEADGRMLQTMPSGSAGGDSGTNFVAPSTLGASSSSQTSLLSDKLRLDKKVCFVVCGRRVCDHTVRCSMLSNQPMLYVALCWVKALLVLSTKVVGAALTLVRYCLCCFDANVIIFVSCQGCQRRCTQRECCSGGV